jgi:hypothetical protein
MTEFRTTYAMKLGIRVLSEHALSLPPNDPARELIKQLVRRWEHEGQLVEFTMTGLAPVLTRTDALNVLAADRGSLFVTLMDFFGITSEDIEAHQNQYQEIMEEAA